jgi:hypothetical protein
MRIVEEFGQFRDTGSPAHQSRMQRARFDQSGTFSSASPAIRICKRQFDDIWKRKRGFFEIVRESGKKTRPARSVAEFVRI